MTELKPIEGYEGLYSVSKEGRIYSHETGKFLASGKNASSEESYVYVRLIKNGKGQNFSVHRLVANAFVPNPNNLPIVHHIDGNRKNNSAENLQWCTQKENVAHCIESGKFGKMARTGILLIK